MREKIIKITAPYVCAWGDDERIANDLIAAGIGDMREAEHRAEVAERMLKLCENAYALAINEMNPYAFSPKAITSDLVVHVHEFLRQQIEKELAEEKDEK